MKKAYAGGPIPLEEIPAVNARFSQEQSTYNLSYRCKDCQHHDPDLDRCSMRYPKEHFGTGPDICRGARGQLLFCKYFELR